MSLLNREAYKVDPDKLIYDSVHPFDGDAVAVKGTFSGGSLIDRGQVIDVSGGDYSVHAEGGTPSVIAAEDVSIDADTNSVIVPVFTSGTFRESGVVASPGLTDSDKETLREKGIFLK